MAKQTKEVAEKPKTAAVVIGGREHPLAMLGLPEVGQLRAWAKAQQPDPLAAVKPYLDGAEASTQRVMLDLALAEIRRPVAFGSPEFNGAMQTGEGLREVLWLAIKRAGSDARREEADAAADAMTVDQAGDVYALAFGQL